MSKHIWMLGIIVSTYGYSLLYWIMISTSARFFPLFLILILFAFTELWFFEEYEKAIRREYHAQ